MIYYVCYNYDTIVQYHKVIKELHTMSKFAVDNKLKTDDKFKVDEFETLTSLVEKADRAQMYLDTINNVLNTLKEYLYHRFEIFCQSSYGKILLLIRSYFNMIGEKIILTAKYIIEQSSTPEFLENKREKYMRYYKCFRDTNLESSKQQKNDELNDSLYGDDFVKHLSNNTENWENNIKDLSQLSQIDWSKLNMDGKNHSLSEELQTLSQMNDMMQNFSNMMKTGGLNMDPMKISDRKTRRLMIRANKKNKKNK